ncbi:CADN-like protein, partial [Mya arenaria]
KPFLLSAGASHIAIGKPASQSSNYEKDKWFAPVGVDGTAGTQSIRSDTCFHTLKNYQPWWRVDLQADFTINTVVLYNRLDCCIDGGYSDWGSYSVCTEDCGGGTKTRTRTCTNPQPENGGADCSALGAASETADCNTQACPIDGGYSDWGSYSVCTEDCGGGTKTRTRTCTNPQPENGGADCSALGAASETADCNTQACPIDGGYSDWGSYSVCTEDCGGGTKTRTRTCTNPQPENGGADCSALGAASETADCNTQACPIDGAFGNWANWGGCSVTCEAGTKTRTRACDSPEPQHGGNDCSQLGNSTATTSCTVDTMCPIDGGYSTWAEWAECSVTCETGSRTRLRTCTNPEPQYNGADCSGLGAGSQTESCTVDTMCPIAGGYTSWAQWSTCAVTCGEGTVTRTRDCTNPSPQYNGANCDVIGSSSDTTTCSANASCIAWSDCPVTCGGGTNYRVRYCDSPAPQSGGSKCFGDAMITDQCNEDSCYDVDSLINGFTMNTCPTGFFTCQAGGISCIEESFRCDCDEDCWDGSDEDGLWALCRTACRNSAPGSQYL